MCRDCSPSELRKCNALLLVFYAGFFSSQWCWTWIAYNKGALTSKCSLWCCIWFQSWHAGLVTLLTIWSYQLSSIARNLFHPSSFLFYTQLLLNVQVLLWDVLSDRRNRLLCFKKANGWMYSNRSLQISIERVSRDMGSWFYNRILSAITILIYNVVFDLYSSGVLHWGGSLEPIRYCGIFGHRFAFLTQFWSCWLCDSSWGLCITLYVSSIVSFCISRKCRAVSGDCFQKYGPVNSFGVMWSRGTLYFEEIFIQQFAFAPTWLLVGSHVIPYLQWASYNHMPSYFRFVSIFCTILGMDHVEALTCFILLVWVSHIHQVQYRTKSTKPILCWDISSKYFWTTVRPIEHWCRWWVPRKYHNERLNHGRL